MYVPKWNHSRTEIAPYIHVELVNGDIINPMHSIGRNEVHYENYD